MLTKAEQVVRNWRDGGREPDGLARAIAAALTDAEKAGRAAIGRELKVARDRGELEHALALLFAQIE